MGAIRSSSNRLPLSWLLLLLLLLLF